MKRRLGLCLAMTTLWSAAGEAFPFQAIRDAGGWKATPVLAMQDDNRRSAEEFALAHSAAPEDLRASHRASGLVECGDAHGAGQLTLTNDVVVTAAHVLIDERGDLRAKSCDFVAFEHGRWRRITVDMPSMVVGAARPYAASAVNDWAVLKLVQPLAEIEPYELAPTVALNDAVVFVARGHSNWRDYHEMSFEDCKLRALTDQSADGRREFAFDCSTGDGSSGGAALIGADRRQLGAILVGWRSAEPTAAPMPYSPRNYNFVITIDGAFRRALLRVARLSGRPWRVYTIKNQTIDRSGGETAARRSVSSDQ